MRIGGGAKSHVRGFESACSLMGWSVHARLAAAEPATGVFGITLRARAFALYGCRERGGWAFAARAVPAMFVDAVRCDAGGACLGCSPGGGKDRFWGMRDDECPHGRLANLHSNRGSARGWLAGGGAVLAVCLSPEIGTDGVGFGGTGSERRHEGGLGA